jgi:hypothetical protein
MSSDVAGATLSEISFKPYIIVKSRDSSVGIALSYRLDDRGSRVRFPGGGLGIFLFTTASRTALEPTQPPIPVVFNLGYVKFKISIYILFPE